MENKETNTNTPLEPDSPKKGCDKEPRKRKERTKMPKATIWTIKITVVTFVLSAFFSFLSELTSTKAHISIAFILLFFLIAVSIVFDAVGVAATSCDLAPLLSMASRKVRGAKIAVSLVKNAEKVSNICCDVIGDICGIISGACTIAIAIKLVGEAESADYWLTIMFSSVVAAITVGGKSFFKDIAIKNSKGLIMFAARLLSVFKKSA